MRFDPDTVDRLFGAEDAEAETPERLKEYFVSNKAYEYVRSSAPLKILVGHKGVGKSALLRRAHLDDVESKKLSVWLQPSDFVNTSAQEKGASFNKRIELWKKDFEDVVARKSIQQIAEMEDEKKIDIGRDFFKSIKKAFSELKPNVTGAIEKSILENFLREEVIHIYIDPFIPLTHVSGSAIRWHDQEKPLCQPRVQRPRVLRPLPRRASLPRSHHGGSLRRHSHGLPVVRRGRSVPQAA